MRLTLQKIATSIVTRIITRFMITFDLITSFIQESFGLKKVNRKVQEEPQAEVAANS